SKMENVKLTLGGRNDACIVPRVLPVIESAAAVAVLDMILCDERESK
ncbi:MAG: chorismate synthase, partial [Clostridiales bacterium]|nr:chorismate synthase [Clostridiales bacterium]